MNGNFKSSTDNGESASEAPAGQTGASDAALQLISAWTQALEVRFEFKFTSYSAKRFSTTVNVLIQFVLMRYPPAPCDHSKSFISNEESF